MTVIGDAFFAYEIHSVDPDGSTALDWRGQPPNSSSYTKCFPPPSVCEMVLKFMRALGIRFGAFDFSIDMDGRWVFLEVNPSGQFAWLEIATGDKLIDSLIDLLLRTGYEA
jgi:glutathione synthase/RimK-type ligase-like ATP-grasp enzyme